jgi:hypothetical protein
MNTKIIHIYILNQAGQNTEESAARAAFRPGMYLYGYCMGIFGRNSYGVKTIVKVDGNLIVVTEMVWDYTKQKYINVTNTANVDSWVELLISSNTSLAEGNAD